MMNNFNFRLIVVFSFFVSVTGVIASTPYNEWLFYDSSGITISDTGSGGNDGTFMEAGSGSGHGPEWVNDLQRGNVLEFDGNDWILTDSKGILSSNPRTVLAWIYLTQDNYRHTIVQWGNAAAAGQYFRMVIENRRLRLEVASGNSLALNSGDLELNTWYHIALAVDDFNNDGNVKTSEVKFYLNGQSQPLATFADRIINTQFTDSNCYVRLGGAAAYSGSATPREAMTGRLDDLRIYDRALTASEIVESMNQLKAWSPLPSNTDIISVSEQELSWMPGSKAQSHHVYFGDNSDIVSFASPDNPQGAYLENAQIIGPGQYGRYEISLDNESINLSGETAYFWRIDEINESDSGSPWKGTIWSFTTKPFDTTPGNLSSSGNLNSLELNWEPPADITQPLYNIKIAEDLEFMQMILDIDNYTATKLSVDTNLMELDKQYFCRVDAYDLNNSELKGASQVLVLDFEVPFIVDDFNEYNEESELKNKWYDGELNLSGSQLSLFFDADGQSMCLSYDNRSKPYRSEVELKYGNEKNWLKWGVEVLELSFRGWPDNSSACLYLLVSDKNNNELKVYYTGNQSDLVQPAWSKWNIWRIKLCEFTNAGVDLSCVSGIAIGVENDASASGSGKLQIDNLKLDITRCIIGMSGESDLNNDCVADLNDFELLTEKWLSGSYTVIADAGGLDEPLVYYSFDQPGGLNVYDQSGNSYHGTIETKASSLLWNSSGFSNGCLNFDGLSSVVLPQGIFDSVSTGFSVCFWVNAEMASNRDPLIFSSGLDRDTQWDKLTYFGHQPTSQWHHFCLAKDAATGISRIYHDGILVAEDRNSFFEIDGNAITISRIGSDVSGKYDFFKGKLDEFRIYGRALLPEEVVYLFSGPNSTIEQPLVPVISSFDPFPDNVINLKDIQCLSNEWLLLKLH